MLPMGEGERDTHLFFNRTIGLSQHMTTLGGIFDICILRTLFTVDLALRKRLMAFHMSKGSLDRKKIYWTSAYIVNNISHKKFDPEKTI